MLDQRPSGGRIDRKPIKGTMASNPKASIRGPKVAEISPADISLTWGSHRGACLRPVHVLRGVLAAALARSVQKSCRAKCCVAS